MTTNQSIIRLGFTLLLVVTTGTEIAWAAKKKKKITPVGGAAIGAAIGTATIPYVGTAVGAVVGGVVAGAANNQGKNDPGGKGLLDCSPGFLLKSNASGKPWPEKHMGDISAAAKLQVNDVSYTCQSTKHRKPKCSKSRPVLNVNAVDADYCTKDKALTITTEPHKAKCDSESDLTYPVQDHFIVTLGADNCYYYAKPTLKTSSSTTASTAGQGAGQNRNMPAPPKTSTSQASESDD